MLTKRNFKYIFSEYSEEYAPQNIFPVESAGLSGSEYWLLDTPSGPYSLRAWPMGEPSLDRLQFIQAVLWYSRCEGFEYHPLPLETKENKGFVFTDDIYWELLPWIPGEQDVVVFNRVSESSSELRIDAELAPHKLVSAMMTLAQFHESVREFPLPYPEYTLSPGIRFRLALWRNWQKNRIHRLAFELKQPSEIESEHFELRRLGLDLIKCAEIQGEKLMIFLNDSVNRNVSLQAVIGNCDRRHFLFDEDGVCGMIDFKTLTAENVALDVAMLIGSLGGPDRNLRHLGFSAYQSIRPLSEDELHLVNAFELAEILLPSLELLDNVFVKKRKFEHSQMESILDRIRWTIYRLELQCYGKSRFAA